MTQSLITGLVFIGLIACLPFAVRWMRQQAGSPLGSLVSQAKFISAVSVGPNQRVVTVEVGPEGKRVWLTVGVTPQAVTCLHTAAIAHSTEMVASSDMTLMPPAAGDIHA